VRVPCPRCGHIHRGVKCGDFCPCDLKRWEWFCVRCGVVGEIYQEAVSNTFSRVIAINRDHCEIGGGCRVFISLGAVLAAAAGER
jgi:hypothetical protein